MKPPNRATGGLKCRYADALGCPGVTLSAWRKLAWQALVPLGCTLLGLLLLLADPAVMRGLRNAMFDQYQRWQPRAYLPAPVRIVDIDEQSLARMGQWPWPRTQLAALVSRLQDAGVAAIGFDVVLAEPDRTSPQTMVGLWGLQGGLADALRRLPDHDSALAQAVAQGRVTLGLALQRGLSQSAAASGMPVQAPYRFVESGSSAQAWLHAFDTWVPPLHQLQEVAAGMGALAFVPDNDGVVRRVPMVLLLQGKPVPSLVAEMLRVAQGAKNYVLKSAEAAGTGLQEVRIGNVTVPTTSQGEVWLHYSRPVAARYIPAWKVIAGEVPVEELDGNLVLVGSSAQGLMDLRVNALGQVIPGVEAHAQALEQILTTGGLQRPAWATALEAIVMVLCSLLVGLVALWARALWAAALAVLSIVGIGAAAWYGFAVEHLLLNVATPTLVVFVTFVVASLTHHFVSERRQRWVREAFSRYVSPNRVQHLVNNPGQLELGGRRQECSFVFTDLAGFTHLMESIDPGVAVSLLNAYLDPMIGIAFRHGGTLDRIVGDAVAIMFSAPVQQADHRARALACALEMQAFASQYAQDIQHTGVPFGITRIGIHSGEVIVGNFGGTTMFDYRALGDPVNTAARLEGANKYFGTQICVSADTLHGCPGAVARPIGRVVLVGKSQALEVLEPELEGNASTRAPLIAYGAAFACMRAAGQAALAQFEELLARYPDDPLVNLHTRRLRDGAGDDTISLGSK